MSDELEGWYVIPKGAVDAESLRGLLEMVIDKAGLPFVLFELAAICTLKAEHISTNWQDPDLATRWMFVQNKIEMAARRAQEKLP